MEVQNNTPEGQGGDADVTPRPPEGTVADVAALSLAELNQHLGKQFPDKETALKSLKDTFSYVGKKKEDIAREIGGDNRFQSVEQELAKLRKDMWFKDNPEHAPYRNFIEKMGQDPSEVIASKEYSTIFEKAKGYDELQSKRTVLESNPRIAASKESFTKASEAQKAGRHDQASDMVAQSVREAFKF